MSSGSVSTISDAFFTWINNTTGIENCYLNITDSENNVYVVGSSNATNITINNIIYSTSGFKKYIIKFNSSGTVVWLKLFDGDPTFTGITINNNYLYLSLTLVSTIAYDSVSYPSGVGFGSTTNGAIIKINIATGAGIWVKYLYRTSSGSVECNGLVVDNNDYLYICGVSPNSSFILGRTEDSGGTQTITGGSVSSITNGFVIKIDGANTAGWYKSTRWIEANTSGVFLTSIILDSTSTNVYLYGYSVATILTINSGTYTIATDSSSYASYLVKLLTSDFSVGWVKSVDGNSITAGTGERNESKTIMLDTSDNPIITGYTNSTSVVVNSVTYTKGVSTTNTFVVKFNTDGTTSEFKWITGNNSDLSVLGFGSSLFGNIPNPPPDLNNFVITIYIPNDGDSITLPLNGVSSVLINWDDGTQTSTISETYEHTYDSEGTYYIEISGNITQFGNGLTGYPNADKIQDILSWGNLGLTSLSGAFKNAVNITSVPNTLPATVSDISYMFYGASLFNSVNVLSWDLANVENINYVFLKASSFNRNIGNWNITNTNLKNRKFIYYQATAYNQELSGWIYDKITKIF